MTGEQLDPKYISIDKKDLMNGLSVCHKVTDKHIAELILKNSQCQILDAGELHLLAWLKSNYPDSLVIISTADKAAIVSTYHLGWLDSVKSLEYLMKESGVSKGKIKNIFNHFTTSWLDKIKCDIKLNNMHNFNL